MAKNSAGRGVAMGLKWRKDGTASFGPFEVKVFRINGPFPWRWKCGILWGIAEKDSKASAKRTAEIVLRERVKHMQSDLGRGK